MLGHNGELSRPLLAMMSPVAVPPEVQRVFDEWQAAGQPPQPLIAWQRERWIERYPALTAKFNALPDQLDRAVVRADVLDKPLTDQGMFDAMIATYAWGWSVTRVGIARAARVLTAGPQQVGPALLGAREMLLAEGPLAGYWALARDNKISGLGPAFGTKFLYFCSAEDARALILDRLMATWLAARTPLTITASRFTKRDYKSYLDKMSSWSEELETVAPQLEEIIFSDEARRRGLPGWAE